MLPTAAIGASESTHRPFRCRRDSVRWRSPKGGRHAAEPEFVRLPLVRVAAPCRGGLGGATPTALDTRLEKSVEGIQRQREPKGGSSNMPDENVGEVIDEAESEVGSQNGQ